MLSLFECGIVNKINFYEKNLCFHHKNICSGVNALFLVLKQTYEDWILFSVSDRKI